MEQNTQSSENNNQAENNVSGGQIFNEPKKKNNKKIVLLIGVVMIIFGAVALYFLFFSSKEDDSTPILENEKNEEVEIDKEFDSDQDGLPDYIEKVLKTSLNNSDTDGDGYSDFEEIKNGYNPINDKKYTEEEWEGVKEKIKNEDEELYQSIFSFGGLGEKMNEALTICQKIEDSKSKDYCTALIKGDSSICEDSPEGGLRDACYYSMASITKDALLCEKVSYKDFCLAVLTNDYEKCKMVDNRDGCYREIAVLTKDFSGCEHISNKAIFNICSAYTKLDASFCKEFEGTNKESCYINVAKEKGDSSLCDTIQSDKKEMCIAIADKNKEDLDCAKYPTQCGDLASMTQDVSICDSIPAKSDLYSASKNDCYLNVARHILAGF